MNLEQRAELEMDKVGEKKEAPAEAPKAPEAPKLDPEPAKAGGDKPGVQK